MAIPGLQDPGGHVSYPRSVRFDFYHQLVLNMHAYHNSVLPVLVGKLSFGCFAISWR